MTSYNDPQVVRGCECAKCLRWQHDNELDVNNDGYCWSCVDEMEEEEFSDDSIITLRPDWREIVGQIVIPRRG